MNRSRDGLCAVRLRRIDHCGARLSQGFAHFGDTAAHRRSGLNLRAQELWRYLVLSSPTGAFVENGLVRLRKQVVRRGIYKEKLFLDAKRDV